MHTLSPYKGPIEFFFSFCLKPTGGAVLFSHRFFSNDGEIINRFLIGFLANSMHTLA